MRLPPSNPSVLVATADLELKVRLSEILDGLCCSVAFSADGDDALRILRDCAAPGIAMLDAALRGRTGLDLAAEVKRRPGKKQTWIMLLSRAADPAIVDAAAQAGVDDLLLCPVTEVDLRVRLNVAGRVQELTRQLEDQAQIVGSQATHDHLTGLWNRESLLTRLFPETDRVQRLGTPLGFLLLEIDHFARVKTEYGYETGGKLLQEVANRLRRYLRSYDLIGRCGEEGFLIALPGCSSSNALQLASRIRTILLGRPFAAGRDVIALTTSIGVAQSRGRSPLVVLCEAERALDTARREGRNCEREFIQAEQRSGKES